MPNWVRMSDLVLFPLFHGTSTLYIESFRNRAPPSLWPYRDRAIELLGKTLKRLVAVGGEVEFWERDTLTQASGNSNWQHGQLYLTPSRYTATKYARTGGRNGGELFAMCSKALDRLGERDAESANALLQEASDLRKFLQGGGSPMLVVFERLRPSDLEAEKKTDSVDSLLDRLSTSDGYLRGVFAQQSNFRLKPSRGTVSRIESIE